MAAFDLGVHRNHLYLVLSGKRVSKRLKKRFDEWSLEQKRQEAKAHEQTKSEEGL